MSAARSVKAAVVALAKERPEWGKVRVARELCARGIRVSPSGVHLIWRRHGLAHGYQRLLLRRREAGTEKGLSPSQRRLLQRMRVARRHIDGALGRERLVMAAARVLGERGYEGATLTRICAAAGILPGSLYHHFKSKEDLFVTVHAEGFKQLNEAVDSALGSAAKDPWSRLEAACGAHLTLLVGSPDVSLVTGTSLFHTAPPALQRRLNRDRDAYEARYARLIDALQLPADVDATLLRLNLLGALNWTRMWYRPGKRHPKALAHHLVQVILRLPLASGVRAPSPNSL
ncbi:MAG TPA: TetR family transcriptional regulator [Burkholderiales bacterium]|nr:TetR family transcriptional regulator [Burkholderiales bacterium]